MAQVHQFEVDDEAAAFAYAQDREDALSAGCDAYLSKPVDIRALPSQLEEILHAAGR